MKVTNENLTLTTQNNGRTYEWITIIENGIPQWVLKSSMKKHTIMENLDRLFKEAISQGDDEPVIKILTKSGKCFYISHFPYAGLFLCEDLEGRYSTVSTLTDALWDLISDEIVIDYVQE